MSEQKSEILSSPAESPRHLTRSEINKLIRDRVQEPEGIGHGPVFRENLEERPLTVGELEMERLLRITEVLNHPELDNLIEEGEVTLGMIRPIRAGESKVPGEDEEVAARILRKIHPRALQIIFLVSLQMTGEDVEELYASVKDTLQAIVRQDEEENQWQHYKNLLTSGAVTFFLLYDPEGEAVKKWRDVMGATFPEKATPGTIRRELAVSIDNNLVHGSDSVESVKQEVNWLRRKMLTWRVKLEDSLEGKPYSIPTEQVLKELGIVPQEGRLIVLSEAIPYRLRGESVITVYRAVFEDQGGARHTKYIAEKSNIRLLPKSAAEAEFANTKFLESQGVRIVPIYGLRGATIYKEWIEEDKTNEALRKIQDSSASLQERRDILGQLVRIAAVLDRNGFDTLVPFWNAFIFDGRRGQFLLLDGASWDVGTPHPGQPTTRAKKQLIRAFAKTGMGQFIEEGYRKARERKLNPA